MKGLNAMLQYRRRLSAAAAALLMLGALAGCSGKNGDDIPTITVPPAVHTTTKPKQTETTAPPQGETAPAPSPDPDSTKAPEPGSDVTTAPSAAPQPGASATGTAIANLANSLIGTSYKLGGTGPSEFDNPGFVYYCYKQNGIFIPRNAAAMAEWGTEIQDNDIEAGDILVFANDIGGDPGFVAVYIGDYKMVACSNPERPTDTLAINVDYWSSRFITARRAG